MENFDKSRRFCLAASGISSLALCEKILGPSCDRAFVLADRNSHTCIKHELIGQAVNHCYAVTNPRNTNTVLNMPSWQDELFLRKLDDGHRRVIDRVLGLP